MNWENKINREINRFFFNLHAYPIYIIHNLTLRFFLITDYRKAAEQTVLKHKQTRDCSSKDHHLIGSNRQETGAAAAAKVSLKRENG